MLCADQSGTVWRFKKETVFIIGMKIVSPMKGRRWFSLPYYQFHLQNVSVCPSSRLAGDSARDTLDIAKKKSSDRAWTGRGLSSALQEIIVMVMKNGNKGLTLVEVIIVIVIIGILAALSVPAIKSWLPNQQLRSAANELYSNLQWAKLNAIRKNETWSITFDAANLQYRITDGSGATVRTASLSGYRGGVDFGFGDATIQIGGDVAEESNPVTYVNDFAEFDSRGMASSVGYVYLKNDQNRAYAIGNNISGFVMLRRWRGGAWQ
jgi:type IV fimbrial biogenesis protein FimT